MKKNIDRNNFGEDYGLEIPIFFSTTAKDQ